MLQKTWEWSIAGGQFRGQAVEEIIDILETAGFCGLEAGLGPFLDRPEEELTDVVAEFKNHGLRIETYHLPFGPQDDVASFYESVRTKAVDTAKKGIERSLLLGARIGILHPTTSPHSAQTEGFDKYLGQLAKSLSELLPLAESNGYIIALENMLPGPGDRFGSLPGHFERIIAELDSPALGVCLDTGHALVALGIEKQLELFDVVASKLAAFHLADNPGDRDLHIEPGRGLVDWRGLFDRVAELGFTSSMCIETAPFAPGPPYPKQAYVQMLKNVETFLPQHGQ